MVAGVALRRVRRQDRRVSFVAGRIPFVDVDTREQQRSDRPGYVYGNLNLPSPVTWTLGLSYDDFEQGELEVDKVNPKLGVSGRSPTICACAARSSRWSSRRSPTTRPWSRPRWRASTSCSTTPMATESLRYGVGLDWQLARRSVLRRRGDLARPRHPVFRRRSRTTPTSSIRRSRPIRAYVYWNPLPGVGAFGTRSSTTASRPSGRCSPSQDEFPKRSRR